MSKGPGEELENTVKKKTKANEQALEDIDPGYETTIYKEPIENLPRLQTVDVPASIFAGGPLPLGGPGYIPFTGPGAQGMYETSRAARAAYEARLSVGRAAAQQALATLSPEERQRTIIRTDPRTGLSRLAARPLAVEMDPLVQQLSLQTADVENKIRSLIPTLTEKQKIYLDRRWETITHHRKGKKGGDPKTPTTDQLNKLLFRALELHASRRAAQLGAQARRARRERHALQQKGRTIAMPDGSVVGTNKRHYKKLASNAVRKAGIQAAQAEAKAVRKNITQINKERRVAIARAHDRKVQPKDLLPARN
jgi:hypothetical protein